jgi:Ca2+-transporting ATPase
MPSATIGAALQVAAVAWSPLRDLLGLSSVTPGELAAVLVISAAPGIVVRLVAR